MTQNRFRTTLAAAAMLLALPACDDPGTGPEDPMDTIREATRAFQQVDAALAAGYAPAGPCVAHPTMGGMGFHYGKQALVDAVVDPRNPETLLYAPGPNGSRVLVGVEFLVPADAWDASHAAPPVLAGQAFDDHRAPAARHGLPFPHYDLHVWVWKENPSGLFAPFNPTVSCG